MSEVILLAHATGGDVRTTTEVTRKLAIACVDLSLKHGWTVVLDGMLSAYFTMALKHVGPAQLAEVLTDLADETLRRRQ